MSNDPSRRIRTVDHINVEIDVPPSKSYTNRALIAASLADGPTTMLYPSASDDSMVLIKALREFGVTITEGDDSLEITGTGGKPRPPSKTIHIGNAGTAMRFLTTFASLTEGETTITGDEQMLRRPVGDLLDALKLAGVKSSSNNGYPPVTVYGGHFTGGRVLINGTISSQFISSLLLSAPYAKQPVHIKVQGQVSSLPYVDMSLYVMRLFGAEVTAMDPSTYLVSNKQRYIGQTFHIEADASSATYFFSAAAITGGRVVVKNLSPDSLQGDIQFIDILSEMGCKVARHPESIEVEGGKLYGTDIDMNALPDCVPALAIVAAFAQGPTNISNIRHLQYKESNRMSALSTELSKIGAEVELHEDGLTIHPRPLHGSVIETYNDHRMAMSFAIAGLRIKDMVITNPSCVTKSFPDFWDEFAKLESKE